jgi:hypothetical protein
MNVIYPSSLRSFIMMKVCAVGFAMVSCLSAWADDAPATKPKKPSEAAEMFWVIVGGKMPMPGSAWFHPGETRYGWTWLTERHGIEKGGSIPRDKFQGSSEMFERLDRVKDGSLTAMDFDWSDTSMFNRMANMARNWFGMHDGNSNGKLTKEEWDKMFARASQTKGYLTPDDLRELFPLQPPARPANAKPPEMPSRWTLFNGLLSGEIGSMQEGPRLGEKAPDFNLRTHDGKGTIQLSKFRGAKPVVLIFGSFT